METDVMNIAIVTGASSGMGRDFALQISKRFATLDEIWIIARRKERLEELKKSITNVKIRPISMDITNSADMNSFEKKLKETNPCVRILVNGAGYGIIGQFTELAEDNIGMCELNCVALTKMINLCLPYMNQKNSNIINLASSAAFCPQPSFAVYAATKSYVLSLSTALNKELSKTGIRVTAVCPGPVDTEFFDKAEIYHNVKLYKKMVRAKSHKVVELALNDAYRGRHISIYGATMNLFRFVAKILPHNFIVKFIK